MALESSFVCLFLTRLIWGSRTLWDSYLLDCSSWCHVLMRAQKWGKGLWFFFSLKSKRRNEGVRDSTLNPSLGWQRWFSRNPLEGTEQELGLCHKRHAGGLSHRKVCDISVAAPTINRVVLINTGGAQIPESVCSSEEPIYLFSSQPEASCLFYIITNKDLSMKPTPDGHSCCNCWRFLYPLALLMHSIALFSSYFDGKDISALPLCKSRMEVSRALIYCCCSSDCSSSISGQLLHRNWTAMANDLIAIFLFHLFTSPSL